MAQQQGSKKQRIIRVAVLLAILPVLIYVGIGALLYTFQRSLLYPGVIGAVAAPAEYKLANVEAEKVKTDDGLELTSWFTPPKDAKTGIVVVYFHGNGDNLLAGSRLMPFYTKRGYGVFLCEYRGYSGNPGKPTEEGLYTDARACVSWLKDHGYGLDRIVLYGESLGTGVAVQTAVDNPPRLLILESPYTSVAEVVKQFYSRYPVDLMLKDRYDSIDKIAKVKAPVLVVHGDLDTLVPFEMGQAIYAAANEPKTFIKVDGGGHDNLYAFNAGQLIPDWLDKKLQAAK